MSSLAEIRQDVAAVNRDALVQQIFNAASGAMQLFTIYIGDQLGFYEVLASDGPMTSGELACRTGTAERYVREWLEQQCVVGIVAVENPNDEATSRRFYLPAGHDEVLADRENLDYMAPVPQLVVGAMTPLRSVVDAFRSGKGVPYAAYGRDLVEGQARMNRAMFLYQLGQEWLPHIPGLADRLKSDPPARIADFGCGAGWSSIGVTQSYPKVLVDGFDLDADSIEIARANAAEAGVSGRVTFAVRDAGDKELEGKYDLVMALECVHDMSDPVAALQTMRRLAKEDGSVLVVDERVADCFDPKAGGFEWLMYGFSVLHCLPAGMAEQPSAGTGTVMRCCTFTRYAKQAGFRDIEVLPIEHPLFRFYHLKP